MKGWKTWHEDIQELAVGLLSGLAVIAVAALVLLLVAGCAAQVDAGGYRLYGLLSINPTPPPPSEPPL